MLHTTRSRLILTTLAAAAALAACGGGGGGAGSGGGGGGTTPVNRHPHADRIEPLDTKNSTSSASAAKQTPVRSARPTGVAATNIALPAPAAAQLQTLKNLNAASDQPKALQVGFGREVPLAANGLAEHLVWTPLADGSQVAAVTISSEGARGIRIPAVVQSLPEGAVLRFLADGQADVAEQYSAQDIRAIAQRQAAAGTTGAAAQTIHGPYFDGDRATIEIQLPAGADVNAVHVAVPRLQHLVQSVTDIVLNTDAVAKHVNHIGRAAGNCHQDAMCSAPETQRRAVAKYLVDGDSYDYLTQQVVHGTGMCTGTLMNNTADDKTPYFATAWHCLSQQSEADTVRSYWFFHSAACGQPNTVNPAYQQLGGGSQLVYTQQPTDFTMLKLNAAAPAGAYFSGSYTGGNDLNLSIEGLHHPAGDLMKYSKGSITGWVNATFDQVDVNGQRYRTGRMAADSATQATGTHIQVRWSEGTTLGGSSGSGLLRTMDGKRYLIGVLSGGGASCERPQAPDWYGRFDRVWQDSPSVRSSLRPR